MGNKPQQQKDMVSYLLGNLPEADQERLEEQYFNNNEIFLKLIETEDQLINDYLNDRLAGSERRLFEQNFLSSSCRQEKFEFVYLLRQSEEREFILKSSRPEIQSGNTWLESILGFFQLSRPLTGALVVAISLIAIGALVWLAKNQLTSQPNADVALMSSQTPAAQVIENIVKPAGQQIVSLELSPGSQRSSGNAAPQSNTAYTGPGTQLIELKLKLTGITYPRYQGSLKKVDDGVKEILKEDSLKLESIKNKKMVVMKVEAVRLPEGDYRVELQGVRASGDNGETSSYEFNVRSR